MTIKIAKTHVTVYSDDTDVCLLFHHSLKMKNVYMYNITRQKDQARSCYSISETTNQPYLLFAHAFTVCNTISAIHRFGKTLLSSKDWRIQKIWGKLQICSSKATRLPKRLVKQSSHSLRHYTHQSRPWLKFVNENTRIWSCQVAQKSTHLSFHHLQGQNSTMVLEYTIKIRFG